jgi:transcriptional regulator with AAA-type ATPase domain
VRLVLERSGRNKRKACRALGISYHTLQAYLRYAHKLQASGVQESAPEYSPDS